MNIDLTDKQVDKVLSNCTDQELYCFLRKNKARSFSLFCKLLINDLNYEHYFKEIVSLLKQIPIQRELF